MFVPQQQQQKKRKQRCVVEKPKPRPRKPPEARNDPFYCCGEKVMSADVFFNRRFGAMHN